ncbi:hypothetical protein BD311DRAFT_752414 [Dichomitus squalens]|uniref:Uncharacterized protein n=1 Tax=Dichomitus squalens TaxID=114155 RepID=A0A4Q9MYV2_9APHY|nr:hypothetical protein BD311DRAFT_769632 [Dichomitus squalens]TBU31761.1 hypothetical protein BD311DRAFT_752414 [Dichomitus squalens]
MYRVHVPEGGMVSESCRIERRSWKHSNRSGAAEGGEAPQSAVGRRAQRADIQRA